jgi:hypothetical protein
MYRAIKRAISWILIKKLSCFWNALDCRVSVSCDIMRSGDWKIDSQKSSCTYDYVESLLIDSFASINNQMIRAERLSRRDADLVPRRIYLRIFKTSDTAAWEQYNAIASVSYEMQGTCIGAAFPCRVIFVDEKRNGKNSDTTSRKISIIMIMR